MEEKNQSFDLSLNSSASDSQPTTASTNPLNTGNGVVSGELPTEPLTAPMAAPAQVSPISQPILAAQPMPAPQTTPPSVNPEKSGKKIIIYAIIAILFAAIAYGAYLFFFNSSEEITEEPPTIDIAPTEENSVSPEKMEELEAVVEELREVYGEQPATNTNEPTDDSADAPTDETASETENPPSLTVGTEEEPPAKVLR